MSSPIDLQMTRLFAVDQFYTNSTYQKDLEGVMVPEGMIRSRTRQLSREISQKYGNEKLLAICVLDGAMKFYTDLFYNDQMWVPFEVASIDASSYGREMVSSGEVSIGGFDFRRVTNRKIMFVEDIIDSGRTLTKLIENAKQYNPSSIETACLVEKPSQRLPEFPLQIDYLGFKIPDEFIVGYGLDFADRYRGLRHIGVLNNEAITRVKAELKGQAQ